VWLIRACENGGRKVWRKRERRGGEIGVMLNFNSDVRRDVLNNDE
jgi:hypothetical protein